MTKIKVPLQFHQSAVESAVKNTRLRRSGNVSSISAVEIQLPAPHAHTHTRFDAHMQETALTELHPINSALTCKFVSFINGTATELPMRGTR
ncbi:hypothetical protein [Streptomyces sp. NPDC001315]|uniref:hypothetical protein n=1 Tax=Streptomyces sp. NPDC001315 TaxID=3364562 RepID=UPI0036A09484